MELSKRRRSRLWQARARSGFTLLEVTISGAILIFAALALSQAIGQSMKLAQTNRETALAQAAIRQALEDLQAHDFTDIFACYNSITTDDPVGEDAPGVGFDVPGLTAREGDADGMVGRVFLPEVTDGITSTLREDFDQVDPTLGFASMDLNGDGDVDEADHSGDYQVLPVRIRLEWTGKGGDRVLDVRTLVSDK